MVRVSPRFSAFYPQAVLPCNQSKQNKVHAQPSCRPALIMATTARDFARAKAIRLRKERLMIEPYCADVVHTNFGYTVTPRDIEREEAKLPAIKGATPRPCSPDSVVASLPAATPTAQHTPQPPSERRPYSSSPFPPRRAYLIERRLSEPDCVSLASSAP